LKKAKETCVANRFHKLPVFVRATNNEREAGRTGNLKRPAGAGFPDRITVSNPSLFRLAMRPTPAELLPGVKHILSDRTSNLRPNLGKFSSGLLSASSGVMTKSEQPDFPFPRRDGSGENRTQGADGRQPGGPAPMCPFLIHALSFVRKTMRVWHPPPKPPARLSAIAKGW